MPLHRDPPSPSWSPPSSAPGGSGRGDDHRHVRPDVLLRPAAAPGASRGGGVVMAFHGGAHCVRSGGLTLAAPRCRPCWSCSGSRPSSPSTCSGAARIASSSTDYTRDLDPRRVDRARQPRHFDSRLHSVWNRLRPGCRTAVTILLIDVDHYKAFNDGYGHQAGTTPGGGRAGGDARPRDPARRHALRRRGDGVHRRPGSANARGQALAGRSAARWSAEHAARARRRAFLTVSIGGASLSAAGPLHHGRAAARRREPVRPSARPRPGDVPADRYAHMQTGGFPARRARAIMFAGDAVRPSHAHRGTRPVACHRVGRRHHRSARPRWSSPRSCSASSTRSSARSSSCSRCPFDAA